MSLCLCGEKFRMQGRQSADIDSSAFGVGMTRGERWELEIADLELRIALPVNRRIVPDSRSRGTTSSEHTPPSVALLPADPALGPPRGEAPNHQSERPATGETYPLSGSGKMAPTCLIHRAEKEAALYAKARTRVLEFSPHVGFHTSNLTKRS